MATTFIIVAFPPVLVANVAGIIPRIWPTAINNKVRA